MARKDTPDAHGGQAGRKERLYKEARARIMIARNVDKIRMNTNAALESETEEEALKSSSKAFLACLFILMADNAMFKPLKVQLENNYLLGKESYLETVVASKRLLLDFITPEKLNYRDIKQEDDDERIAFVESSYDKYCLLVGLQRVILREDSIYELLVICD